MEKLTAILERLWDWSMVVWLDLLDGSGPLLERLFWAWLAFAIWAFLADCILWLFGLGPKDKP